MHDTLISSTARQTECQDHVDEYTGYVAFLDVLGFRSIVAAANNSAALRDYVDSVDRAVRTDKNDGLQYVIFSDSVIVNSVKDDDESFLRILEACATLFGEFLRDGIMVRGAIAHGTYLHSSKKHGTFVAGAPIVEAVHYEGRQNWIGIMICPSTIRKQKMLDQQCKLPQQHEFNINSAVFDSERLRLPSLLALCYMIPFHRENELSLVEPDFFEGYTLLPTGTWITHENIVKQLKEAIQALQVQKMSAPGPKEQSKFKSTIQWLEGLQRSWEGIVASLNQTASGS